MNSTKIEWTGKTWNTVRGCNKVSDECLHCYAETFAERFRGVAGHPYEAGFDVRLVPEKLVEPFEFPNSEMIFVNSMSDCFHKLVPDAYLEQMAAVMLSADWHIYQVLTKRHERMSDLLATKLAIAAQAEHIWWGVSVGNKKHGVPRIKVLQESKARVKWLSVEPLLEDLGSLDLTGIDWVVVGGESGPEARPMEKAWVESLQIQCAEAGVPFFFKQWGGIKKSETGRLLNGRTYSEMPPILTTNSPAKSAREAEMRKWIQSVALAPATVLTAQVRQADPGSRSELEGQAPQQSNIA